MAEIEIRRLAPDLAEAYADFFDATPHNEKYKAKCYCVYWCGEESGDMDYSTKKSRRDYAVKCVRENKIRGYFAYLNGKAVGWCNANTKSDCLACRGWQGINGPRRGYIPTEGPGQGIRVKSVFCFVIAPEMRRQGVATLLLERVCLDAANEGFDFAEAYPDKEVNEKSENYPGYANMYFKCGFTIFHETKRKLVMRKRLR